MFVHNFNVGDAAVVRSDLPDDKIESQMGGACYTTWSMLSLLAGKTVHIKEVRQFADCLRYKIEEDHQADFWIDEFLEPPGSDADVDVSDFL